MRRVATLVLAAVVASSCALPGPTAAPAATATAAATTATPGTSPMATAAATPAATATPMPATLPVFAGASAAQYLVDTGHPIAVQFGADPITWAPRTDMVTPGGAETVRFALLPVTCPPETDEAGSSSTGVFIGAARTPDAWETDLAATPMLGGWSVKPGPPACIDGELRGNVRGLDFYRIEGTEGGVALSAVGGVDAGETMTVLPVYSSLDVEHPSFAMPSSMTIALGKAGAAPIVSTTVGPTELPDGSMSDHAAFQVTGCASPATGDVTITMRLDGADPVEVATCADGSYSQVNESIDLAGADHQVELFATGKTRGTTVRIGQSDWREQP